VREIQVLEDREIVRRCRLGQTDLMDVLIERHKTDLYSLCKKLTRNAYEADDLFQDTWVNVMKNLHRYSAEHRFKTWLFAICLNRYRDLHRWRKRWLRRITRMPSGERKEDAVADFGAPGADPEETVIFDERKAAVREALEKLEDMFRLPILLHYFQDLSLSEIGDILGIPPGTVKSRLSKGRQRLRVAMEDAGHGRA
jgi:RNA polymerase sigma-70 factor (ECF subfamily)